MTIVSFAWFTIGALAVGEIAGVADTRYRSLPWTPARYVGFAVGCLAWALAIWTVVA